ncbi:MULTISPECIES: helix-turn-helix domain-containing protein [unclassified Streptomyces]|uniref:PucR family transcriptional regulator n=1 Tax=unclassified Streptomyces TaxID=2593676 RepID=UPI002E809896|nr:helix-turn-helix domain-containing protein [Streptomyces sp. NBC_00589]WTI35820.1 helix-turn-helix domain-containing protein [Streptomyces sp. NBC_00775]WUB30506.1 helix-turn-helix domain-containing protein [Streptomyces sp. NBC_00589]
MPLSAAARALALRCEPRVNELARRMSRESFEALPGYAELPDDLKDLEIAATARHGIRLFLRRAGDPDLARADLRLFRERAAQRAEEGMPLHLLLRTHSLGAYVLWRALRETARPGEEAALVELVDLLLESHHRVVGAVAETYVDERTALEADARAQRRSLVRGLLDGVLKPGHILLDELRLEGPALVLALDLGVSAEGPVGERRRQRRAQTVLDHAFGTEVAALLDTGLGRAVVPKECEPPDDLAQRLSKALGTPVRVAHVPAAGPEDIPEAARTAMEILRVTRACGLPPGLHRLEDVLLEFHLSRPDPSSHKIAALLDPVADRPELLETLRTHLAHQQDRRATAAALGLHPNTVDNRLAKIGEQSGIDLSSPRGAALAIAALLLRDTQDTPSYGPYARP